MIPGFVGFRHCFGGWLLLFGFGGYVCVCGFRVVGFGCMIYLMVWLLGLLVGLLLGVLGFCRLFGFGFGLSVFTVVGN